MNTDEKLSNMVWRVGEVIYDDSRPRKESELPGLSGDEIDQLWSFYDVYTNGSGTWERSTEEELFAHINEVLPLLEKGEKCLTQ